MHEYVRQTYFNVQKGRIMDRETEINFIKVKQSIERLELREDQIIESCKDMTAIIVKLLDRIENLESRMEKTNAQ